MTLGENIRRMRKARGMRQQNLADILGVTRSSIANWELGCAAPSANMLPAIAQALQCDMNALFSCASCGPACLKNAEMRELQAQHALFVQLVKARLAEMDIWIDEHAGLTTGRPGSGRRKSGRKSKPSKTEHDERG